MTTIDRILFRLALLALVGWLIGHWKPAPVIELKTVPVTVKQEYAGLPAPGFEEPK